MAINSEEKLINLRDLGVALKQVSKYLEDNEYVTLSDLHAAATSGDYNSLNGKPYLTVDTITELQEIEAAEGTLAYVKDEKNRYSFIDNEWKLFDLTANSITSLIINEIEVEIENHKADISLSVDGGTIGYGSGSDVSGGSTSEDPNGTLLGTFDHNKLTNRNKPNQHPIEAITGLQDALETLQTNIDSKTVGEDLLLDIQDALDVQLKRKAKGMYYGVVDPEIRPYWYLCSETDPITGQGTPSSIIAGPYDLGQGGGGGGGGSTNMTDLELTNIKDDVYLWPANVVVNAECNLVVYWTSTRNNKPTGKGTMTLYINNVLVETRSVGQGEVVFSIGKYINSSENKIEVKVVDAYSSSTNLIGTITGVDINLSSTFNSTNAYKDSIIYNYTATGNVNKTMHFIVDGEEYGTDVVTTSGEQQFYQIDNLTHGNHDLLVYFECQIEGANVRSNELHYDVILYKDGETAPIIASPFNKLEQEQYIAFNIPYVVYTPNRNLSKVELYVNNVLVSSLNDVTQDLHYWEYKNNVVGYDNLKIKSGNTERTFAVHINPSSVNVVPASQNLQLSLSSYGRTNEETLTPEELLEGKTEHPREIWEDKEHNIKCKLTGFNFISDGWKKDAAGNTVLRVSGDARVEIPFKPFAQDVKTLGKTIEIEFATSTVRNYESIIVSCLDRADAVKATTYNVGGEDRQNKIDCIVDVEKFIDTVKNPNTYEFIYENNSWSLNNVSVDLKDYGLTLKSQSGGTIEPMNGDLISVLYGALDRGFYITPQLARIDSQQMSLSTQYKEDDHVRLTFVIESSQADRLICMYIDGILSGAAQYPATDSFRQLDAHNITIGSNDATVDIYSIRVYNTALNRRQVVNNWIADTQDGALKVERALHNDNFDENNQLVINKLPADLPYIKLIGPELPPSKAEKKELDIEYVDPTNNLNNFTSRKAQVGVQGTSSQYYFRKNFKIKYVNGFFNNDWEDDAEQGIKGGLRAKYPLTEGAEPEKTFTYKADVASSEGANNVVLVKYFEDTKNFLTPPERDKGEYKIRTGVDGYPIIAFYDDGNGPKFYGKMNFNNDKGTNSTFGFKEGDESWEILANTNNIANFKNDPATWERDWEDWANAFESRYPEKVEVNGKERMYGQGEGELDRLKQLVTWVASTRQEDATNDVLDEVYIGEEYKDKSKTEEIEVTIIEKDPVTGVETTKKEMREVTNVVKVWEETRFTHDTPAYRIAKFRKELETVGKVDKQCSLFYYLFTELFLLVDNWTKNAFPTWYRARHKDGTNIEIEGGDKWFWLPYDMDTAIGTNNEGLLVFSPFVEDCDKVNNAYVYNGQDSTFWQNIRAAFPDELKKMYQELRASKWSFNDIESRFSKHQTKWSESIFNEDAYTKYLVPLKTQGNTAYLGMAQGSKAQQRRWWLYNRFKYLDSKYAAGDATKNTIMMRAYQRSDFNMIPYSDIYIGARFDNAIVTNRSKRDTRYTLSAPASWNPQDKDSVVAVFSADQLREIGDLSGFKIGGYADFSAATRLKKLIVGSPDESYSNAKLTTLSVGNNTMLTDIDVRNCVELTNALDLTNCINIERVYTDNTKLTAVNLPVGGNLKELTLPATVTNLTIRGHNLEKLVIASTENVERLWLENIPSKVVDSYEIITHMKKNGAVRLMGIDNKFNSVDEIEKFYDALDTMTGLDPQGNDVPKAQVTGKIYVTDIDYSALQTLSVRYPEVTIIPTNIWCLVQFMNDGLLHSSQTIKKGNKALRPDDPEKTPKPEPDGTIKYYYIFNSWDKEFDNIQEDTIINATYDEFLQTYRVYFNTQSQKIKIEPNFIEVDWGTYITRPEELIKGSQAFIYPTILKDTIPEGVSAEGTGWATLNGIEFDFETTPIKKETTLYAQWRDEAAPSLIITRKSFNTIHYEATDNVGIVSYMIKQSTNDPVAEEPGWITLPGNTTFSGDYEINSDGYWKVAVRDSDNNIVPKTIQAYAINTTQGTGVNTVAIDEFGDGVGSFALAGSRLRISAFLDSHYENPKITVNGNPFENQESLLIEDNLAIDVTCSPKFYEVHFHMNGRGSQVETQVIEYLHHAVEPEPQNDVGYVIENWYIDPEFTKTWDFENSPITETLDVYARWVESHEPSLLTINVTEANTEITLCYSQSTPNGAGIDWGDGSPSFRSYLAGSISQRHTYERPGKYVIGVTREEGLVLLGKTAEFQAINPIELLEEVYFAPDVPYTNTYAFKGAVNLKDVGLTRYMTKVASGCYQGCTALTSISLAPNILRIENGAFSYCTGLTGTIKLPTKVLEVEERSFEGCSGIEKVVLNDSLISVGTYAFYGCSSLTEINIPKTIKKLPSFLFAECSSLTEFDVEENIEEIGSNVFKDCSSLSKVRLLNADLKTDSNGLIFDGCPLLETIGPVGGGYDIEYAWETEIPDGAFAVSGNSNSYRTVNIKTGITRIGDAAFQNCTNIASIDIPDSITNIGSNTFARCIGLYEIRIPESVEDIGYNAFSNCTSLRNVYLEMPSVITKINYVGYSWFSYCTSTLRLHIRKDIIDSGISPEEAFGSFWNYRYEDLPLYWAADIDK